MGILRWCILGAGNISFQFVHDLCLNNIDPKSERKHVITCIGTSSKDKGLSFIEKAGINPENNEGVEPAVESYEYAFKKDLVDVVYIGTPHPCHKEQVILALQQGKHVLCEKPITVNLKDARELVQIAREKNKFLMEAVWTRFLPCIQLVRKYVFQDKVLGQVYRLFTDFAYDADISNLPSSSRVRDVNLAGGALLDIGIYTLTYARILLDTGIGKDATQFRTKSFLNVDPEDHVDYNTSVLLKYDNGKQGILTCSNSTNGRQPFLRLEGSKGALEMWGDNPARPRKFRIVFSDETESINFQDDSEYHGFIYEADAVACCIANGEIESKVMPHDESLLVMQTMDQIRFDNGLSYPQDASDS